MGKRTDLDFKLRVGVIASGRVGRELTLLGVALLFVAALVALGAPELIGAATSSRSARGELLLSANPQADDTARYEKFVAEVVSIKRRKQNGNFDSWGMPLGSDTFSARNVTLLRILREAYALGHGTEDNRVMGGPSWLNSDRYDIDAKVDPSLADAIRKLPKDERMKAIQHILFAILMDRCKLAVHRDTKELPIYSLVIAKGGSKLKEASPDEVVAPTAPNADPRRGPGVWMEGRLGPLVGKAVTMTDLANMLQYLLSRTTVDKTGLTGTYTFTVRWEQDENASNEDAEASFLRAFPDQLGLKLESGKGPVEVIVVDHFERPSGN
jgi:uncharacterized protein (TIGR03435 family)